MPIFDGTPKEPGYWRRWLGVQADKYAIRKKWEAENPELAAVWSEAIEEDHRRFQAKNREQWEQGQRDWTEAHLTDCGTPEAIAHMLARSYDRRTAILKVEEFMQSKNTFMLLFGEPGGGKTVAACTAFLTLKAQIETSDVGRSWEWNSKWGLFVSAHELATASYFDVEAKKKLQRMAYVKLLIIDDLGMEMMSESWRSNLDGLIDARYGARRKTILTSNVSAKKEKIPGQVGEKVEWKVSPFEARYGARIARRIRERGVTYLAERD